MYERCASLSALYLETPLRVRVSTCVGELTGDDAYPDGRLIAETESI